MNVLDIVLIVLIVVAVAFALRRMHKQRKRGGCSCCSCSGGCPYAKQGEDSCGANDKDLALRFWTEPQ